MEEETGGERRGDELEEDGGIMDEEGDEGKGYGGGEIGEEVGEDKVGKQKPRFYLFIHFCLFISVGI